MRAKLNFEIQEATYQHPAPEMEWSYQAKHKVKNIQNKIAYSWLFSEYAEARGH